MSQYMASGRYSEMRELKMYDHETKREIDDNDPLIIELMDELLIQRPKPPPCLLKFCCIDNEKWRDEEIFCRNSLDSLHHYNYLTPC